MIENLDLHLLSKSTPVGEDLHGELPLDLVAQLAHLLACYRIDYCHWKSNTFLDRSACGDNDLDLLVNRTDAARFSEILHGLGFKETLAPSEEDLPGVRNYYGYDHPTGRLVHVHAHYQLILGHDLSKNYRLPIERAYLASAIQGRLLRIPSAAFELVVLVVRLTLKHSTWDALLMRHGRLSRSERAELDDLSSRVTPSTVNAALVQVPGLSRELFDLCRQSLEPDCPLRVRSDAGERLQAALRNCARRPRWLDVLLKLAQRVWQPLLKRGFGHNPGSRFASGGLFIAMVGGDGAGKTTVIDALHRWLAGTFEVRKVHMGKPTWSAATVILRGMLKLGTLVGLSRFEGDTYEEMPQPHGYPWFIRAVCTARDRRLTYLRAQRFSTNGGLVLCDRYSFPGLMSMDGPQCEAALGNLSKPTWLHKSLAAWESSYYRQIEPPDLTIVLRLPPETAVRRKVEETAASVRARSAEVWGLDWQALPAVVIDASASQEEVLAQVKALVWKYL